jgi:predicted  nucleic acid-binding Zn-ribbon protein
MNALLQNLLKLQALEFAEAAGPDDETQITGLRARIPHPILGHYDRLRVRGKKALAAVRNQACTGCHMRQPLGKITVLMRDEDIQLCDSCGRYLYLPEESPSEPVEQKPEAKPARKPATKSRGKIREKALRKQQALETVA